jgi:hypothetical protein
MVDVCLSLAVIVAMIVRMNDRPSFRVDGVVP